MNPSISIDEMGDHQATYNKRWPNQSFLSVHVFTFVGSRPTHHSWPAAATPNHDEMLKPLQTHFIRVPKSYLHCGTQYQSWRATKL